MITKGQAVKIMEAYLIDEGAKCGIDLVLQDSNTIECEFGWVFFYDSKKHIKTGEFSDMLLGNAPVIVDKSNGKTVVTGTAYEVQRYIDQYRKTGKIIQ